MAVAVVLAAVLLAGVLAVRADERSDRARVDLGPGPVRGVRVVQPHPGEVDRSCPGLGSDLPVVRLVEQVDVQELTVCLGPGRRVDDPGGVLQAYVVAAADSEGAAVLLDRWAADWSLPDDHGAWWQDPDRVPCQAVISFVPPIAVVVAGRAMRPVVPEDACGPREVALRTVPEISRAARPLP